MQKTTGFSRRPHRITYNLSSTSLRFPDSTYFTTKDWPLVMRRMDIRLVAFVRLGDFKTMTMVYDSPGSSYRVMLFKSCFVSGCSIDQHLG